MPQASTAMPAPAWEIEGAPIRHARAPLRAGPLFLGLTVVLVASLAGALLTLVSPSVFLVGLCAIGLVTIVAIHPAAGAYVMIGVTPLIAGMDRGAVIPLLRPHEALAFLMGSGLVVRGLVGLKSGRLPKLTLSRTDVSIMLLAATGSVLPLLWMLVRGREIQQEDLLYALIVWKYYGVYLIIRFSVRREAEVRRCLSVAIASASVVAVIAIFQSLQVFGVPRLLAEHYAPYGVARALQNSRGGATLSLPIAVADLLTLNLALVAGLLLRGPKHRRLSITVAALLVAGVLASGEFSGFLALVLGAATVVFVTGRISFAFGLAPALAGGAYVLRPVIARRLSGFQSASGLPTSWAGRLFNLRNYFWPELFSRFNFVLGVRPAARVATQTMATGFIWIESGYTWLLWNGGIPFLFAFFYFLWRNVRDNLTVARARDDAVGVAALAVVVGLIVVGVLMVIDPHLTYRGSADLLFVLLALAGIRSAGQTGRATLQA